MVDEKEEILKMHLTKSAYDYLQFIKSVYPEIYDIIRNDIYIYHQKANIGVIGVKRLKEIVYKIKEKLKERKPQFGRQVA